METVVVILVISVALITLFTSYNKILTKLKTENTYDTSEYIYTTNYIKNYIKECDFIDAQSIQDDISIEDRQLAKNIMDETSCINSDTKNILVNLYNVEKIYILTDFDYFGNKELAFDAYMIDYIRKLDVRSSDKLILVEYKRLSRADDYALIKMETLNSTQDYCFNDNNICLSETYIASLEW